MTTLGRRERADEAHTHEPAVDMAAADQQFIDYVRQGLSVSRLRRLLDMQVTSIEATAARLGVYDLLIEETNDAWWRKRCARYCDIELAALHRAHPERNYAGHYAVEAAA